MRAKSLQLCPTVCDPTDCSPSGFSIHEIFRQEYCNGLPFPPPGDLPNPGIHLHVWSLALAGEFFATSATWVAKSVPEAI